MVIQNIRLGTENPLEVLAKIDLSTVQHAAEVSQARTEELPLWEYGVVTGDGAVYTMEEDEPILYITTLENNPVFQRLSKGMSRGFKRSKKKVTPELLVRSGRGSRYTSHRPSVRELERDALLSSLADHLRLKDDEFKAIREAQDTVRVPLVDIKLEEHWTGWYYHLNTDRYKKVIEPVARLIEKAYGEGEVLKKLMWFIKGRDYKGETRFYVAPPPWIEANVKEGKAVAFQCGFTSDDIGMDDVNNFSAAIGIKEAFSRNYYLIRAKLK